MRRLAVAATGAVVLVGLMPAGAALAEPAEADRGYHGIRWQPCADAPEVDCGKITVPVDWSKPRGEKIEVSLARRKATDPSARVGAMLIDPGGPGGAGAELVRAVPQLFSAELHRRYDVVGFDPRGVGESHPVVCSDTTAPPADVTNEAEFTALREWNRAHAANCREKTGKLFDFVDTLSVARDMDAIRAGLGERKLNYLGISYGTLMGQQYAELFPKRVGRFVLDSNMDHSLSGAREFIKTEAVAIEGIFDEFVAWCARTADCPLYGTDVRALHHQLLDRIRRGELVLPDGYVLTVLDYIGAIHGSGYGPDWYELAALMIELRDLGSTPTAPSDALSKRFAGTKRTTKAEEVYPDPFAAIFCQDWRLPVRSYTELSRLRAESARVAPDTLLSPLGYGATLACVGLEDRVTNPQHRLRIKGAATMLFVNSRFDPATPYEWARTSSRQAGGRLLTYDGWGHFTYGKSECVVEKVDRFLITGELPARGASCAAVEPVPPTADPAARSAKPTLPLPTGPRPQVPGWAGLN